MSNGTGYLYVAYAAEGTGELCLAASADGVRWSQSGLGVYLVGAPSMTVLPDPSGQTAGTLLVAFVDAGTQTLSVAFWDDAEGGSWQVLPGPANLAKPDPGTNPSIVTVPQTAPYSVPGAYIAYTSNSSLRLVQVLLGSQWPIDAPIQSAAISLTHSPAAYWYDDGGTGAYPNDSGLMLVYGGTNGQFAIAYTTTPNNTNSYSVPNPTWAIYTPTSAAVSMLNGVLYFANISDDSRNVLFLNFIEWSSSSGWSAIFWTPTDSNGNTFTLPSGANPAMTAFKGNLWIAYRSSDGSNQLSLLQAVGAHNSFTYTPSQISSLLIQGDPALAVYGNLDPVI